MPIYKLKKEMEVRGLRQSVHGLLTLSFIGMNNSDAFKMCFCKKILIVRKLLLADNRNLQF